MFAFITHIRAKSGKRDALIQANSIMQTVTAGERGVPIYAFHTAKDSPDDFYYYDLYASQESYSTHCSTPEFQAMIEQFSELADIIEVTELIPFGPIKSEPV
tara:strand:+ start:651 stop:956 length:306 start_codon:yes stop_codon:yes gene_type:complete